MESDKKPFKEILSKMVVTKEGKRLGFVCDVSFETHSGELIHLVLREPTAYTRNLDLEKSSDGEFLIPYASIIAIGDFIVVSEEDLI
jgi:sporulation protein YlmC with PRC-barrel domain